MADRWLLWPASLVAVAFVVSTALAGVLFVGLFLAGAIMLAAGAAVDPRERHEQLESLRHACNRLPFCDCGPTVPSGH